MERTAQEYKEALNVAMLYIQSLLTDVTNKLPLPSARTNGFKNELLNDHSAAIQQAAAELNSPPR